RPGRGASIPAQDHLAGLARSHELEGLLVVLVAEAVSDDRLNAEAALEHARHLVPGLEHLPAVNAFQGQALEDDLVPVDRRFGGRYAEDGDLAAVMHRAQQVPEGSGVA